MNDLQNVLAKLRPQNPAVGHTLRPGEFVQWDGREGSGEPIIGEVTGIDGANVWIFGAWTDVPECPRYNEFSAPGDACVRTQRPPWWPE